MLLEIQWEVDQVVTTLKEKVLGLPEIAMVGSS
jgi:hypothetical protein